MFAATRLSTSVVIPSFKTALTLLAIVSLTACGGGGGDDGDSGSGSEPPANAVTYTVSTEVGDGGEISPSTQEVAEGATANFTLQPSQHMEVASAEGCSGSLSGNTYTTGPVNADCAISAEFQEATYTVNTQTQGEGSITPSSVVLDPLQTTQFEVSAANRWELNSVNGCGGSLEDAIYTTGEVVQNCTVTANFSELPTNDATIPVERAENLVALELDAQTNGIIIDVQEKTAGHIVFDESLSSYNYSYSSRDFLTLREDGNTLHFDAGFLSERQSLEVRISARESTDTSTRQISQTVVINVLPKDEEEVADGICFEGYCNDEEPLEVKHNLFDDRTFTAHYVAVAPAETELTYHVGDALGEVVDMYVRNDDSSKEFSYEFDYESQTVTIYNPYNYNDKPLINYTFEASNGEGQVSTQTVALMYFNAYAAGRFTNFNDSPVALPKEGSRTFDVALENYGSAGTKEIYIRDIDMMIPSIVGSVDENDTCEADENGTVTLETCDLLEMSVDRETDQVTITTHLKDLLESYPDQFSSGLNLYSYIIVCTQPTEAFDVEECQDLQIAGMEAFISDMTPEEAALIEDLEALMPQVNAFFEYDIAIQELVNMLAVKGEITNTQRETYLQKIRAYSAPLVQEVNIARQYIFNMNGTVNELGDQTGTIEVALENVQYYLDNDGAEADKFALYNRIIQDNGLEEEYGLLQSSPVIVGDDGQPTRFAYNEAYGEIIDNEFVFDGEYKPLQIAVQKSKR